jgi:hypothetical protein
MKIVKFLQRKLNYYTGIDDLPAWNWFRINETDDITYLLHRRRAVSKLERKHLEEIFGKIYEDYINTFGISEMLKQIMILKRDIAVLRLDMAINDDGSRQTFIDIKESELKQILLDAEGENNIQIKAYVEKFMGFHIDERAVSVKDYYSYIELLKREVDNSHKHQSNGRQN